MEIRYRSIKCSQMTQNEINETSQLFSEHYGTWSSHCDERIANKPIKLNPERMKNLIINKNRTFVVLAYYKDTLVGHMFYFRRRKKAGIITWILQLVVHKDFRNKKIGSKMLRSIWGLSDSYACGLYTSNPMTIKALEMATMRKVDPKLVEKNLLKLKAVSQDLLEHIPNWIDTFSINGYVNTNFATNHDNLSAYIDKAYPNNDFSLSKNLPEGYEWLAFTFKSQKPTIDNYSEFKEYMSFSEDILK